MARGKMRIQTNTTVPVRSAKFADFRPKLTSTGATMPDTDSGVYVYNTEDDPKLNVDILGDWVGLRVMNNTGGAITVLIDLMVGDTPCARLDTQTIADGADYGWGPSFFSQGNVVDGGITTRIYLKSNAAGGMVSFSGVLVDA